MQKGLGEVPGPQQMQRCLPGHQLSLAAALPSVEPVLLALASATVGKPSPRAGDELDALPAAGLKGALAEVVFTPGPAAGDCPLAPGWTISRSNG